MILHMATVFPVPERKKRTAVIHGDVGRSPVASSSTYSVCMAEDKAVRGKFESDM
jgi:hypothetical protein